MSEENTTNESKQDYTDRPKPLDADMFTNDMYPRIGQKKTGDGSLKGYLVIFCLLIGFLLVLPVFRIPEWNHDRQEAKDEKIARESLEWSLKQYYGLDKGDYAWDGEFVKMYSGYRCNFIVNGQIYSAEYHSSDWKETDYLVAKFQDGLRGQLLQNIRESNLFPGHVKENVTFTFNKLPIWVTETEIEDFLAGKTNRMEKWKEIETNLGIEFFSKDETVYGVMPSAATFYDALKLGDIGFNVKGLTVSCSMWPIPTDGYTGLITSKSFCLPDDVTKAREMMAEQEPIRTEFRNSFIRMMKEDYGIGRVDLEVVDVTLSENLKCARVQFLYQGGDYDAYSVEESAEGASVWWTNLYYESFIKAAREYLFQKTDASGMFHNYNGISVSARSSKVLKGFGERKVLPSWIGREEVKGCFRSDSDRSLWKLITVDYEINVYASDESDFTESWKRFVPNTADACCTMNMSSLNGYLGTPDNVTLFGTSAYGEDNTSTPVYCNFEGAEITILDWWSDENWREIGDAYKAAVMNALSEAERDFNFTLNRRNPVADTGNSYLETVALSIMNNTSEGQIITFKSREIASFLRSGLLADVKNAASINWDDEKWNAQVKQIMTVNGGLYGFALDISDDSAGIGVYFNPEIFKMLNISPDLPYDLQKEGKWNWEEFTKLCGRLTCDTNNDDQTDIYALSVKAGMLADAAFLSNDTSIIAKDGKTGLLVKYNNDSKVTQALNFVETLYREEYIAPAPNPMNDYDWAKKTFYDCRTAMYIDEEYVGYTEIRVNAPSVRYGFVCFPYGPSAGSLRSIQYPNIMAVPACQSVKKDITAALTAYDIYTTVPDFYDPEGDYIWKKNYDWRHAYDERIIDQTIRIMVTQAPKRMNPAILIPDYDYDTWAEELMNGKDAETVMNSWSTKWNEQIEDFNVKFK